MIYLIGVNHQVQYDRNFPRTKEFIHLLIDCVKDFNIKLIAEEWSNEANSVWSVTTSTVEDVAMIHGIEYIACDPTRAQRRKIGVRSREDIWKELAELAKSPYTREKSVEYQRKLALEDHPKREQFWLEKIKNYKSKEIVFICGTEHISQFTNLRDEGFDTLLEKLGYMVEVLNERFD